MRSVGTLSLLETKLLLAASNVNETINVPEEDVGGFKKSPPNGKGLSKRGNKEIQQ